MTFTVVLTPEEDGDPGWVVHCPAIPGCWSQGETEAEALENIREAITLCVESRTRNGLPVTVITEQVEVAV